MPTTARVALINMPWAPADRPSIQMGILAATLAQAGIASDSFFYNLDFLDLLLRHDLHRLYSAALPALLGEWLFAGALDPERASLPPSDGMRRALAGQAAGCGVELDALLHLRLALAPRFVDRLFERFDGSRHAVVCFTLTYPQLTASFALARRLKARWPLLQTVCGGAASQIHAASVGEYLRLFDFIDVMVVGEAEPVLAEVVAAALERRAAPTLPGVYARRGRGTGAGQNEARVASVRALPVPDYRPFAARRDRLPASTRRLVKPEIPVELARGCPWASRRPCAFCGFYPAGGYRPKRGQQVLAELAGQQERLGWTTFCVVDSTVTRHQIDRIFAHVGEHVAAASFSFVETRSDLPRRALEQLRDAGVRLLQPGIEALDDRLLRRLDKGVTLFDNLLLLKRCRELEIDLSYNLLLGVPGATAAELRRQLALMRLLPHLAPPYAVALNLVRGSRYWRQPQAYRLVRLRPHCFYAEIWPSEIDLPAVAYEFEADRDQVATRSACEAIGREIRLWQRRWQTGRRPELTVREQGDSLYIEDRRNPSLPPRRHLCDEVSAAVYRVILDRPHSAGQIARRLHSTLPAVDRAAIDARLGELRERGLLATAAGRHLALATRCTINR
ncbi:MAG: RiPP maturation radical SAM C-methyltransferase [Deltaproteobacteria bacterium]|nr:RiPP maturation radical SAM C-methyltransferase [Deltaproteobacteria bacterium]